MMAAIDVGLLPVGEGDRLVGMITDRDIAVRAVGEGKGPATQVEQVMTQDVKYCYEDEDTGHIARNMAEQQVRRLAGPVPRQAAGRHPVPGGYRSVRGGRPRGRQRLSRYRPTRRRPQHG